MFRVFDWVVELSRQDIRVLTGQVDASSKGNSLVEG